jgi:hypothetical protein
MAALTVILTPITTRPSPRASVKLPLLVSSTIAVVMVRVYLRQHSHATRNHVAVVEVADAHHAVVLGVAVKILWLKLTLALGPVAESAKETDISDPTAAALPTTSSSSARVSSRRSSGKLISLIDFLS